MYSISELNNLSRKELYSVINQMKRKVNVLTTDLIKYKILLNDFQKYFNYFNEINESIALSKELLDLKNRMIALKDFNEKSCFVSLKGLSKSDQNIDSNNTSDERHNLLIARNGIQFDGIEEEIKTENKVLFEGKSNERLLENIIDPEFDVNEDTNSYYSDKDEDKPKIRSKRLKRDESDSDFDINEDQMSDYSEEELKEFKTKPNRGNNSKRKMRDISGEYICKIDCRSFKTARSLRRHMKVHSTEKPFQCPHEECGKRFRIRDYLSRHLYACHRTDDPLILICDYIGCEKQFKSNAGLFQHKAIHTGIQYKCEYKDCPKVFTTKWKLNKHLIQHKGIHCCDFNGCTFSGKSKSHLLEHKINHSEDRPFVCSINNCDKSFKRKAQIKIHQLSAHPLEMEGFDWFTCEESGCDYKTKCRSDLVIHKTIHTKAVVCDICRMRFRLISEMERHKAVHFAPQMACEWPGCDRKFNRKDILKVHMNQHTRERVYPCDWPGCDELFTSKASSKSHMARHNS